MKKTAIQWLRSLPENLQPIALKSLTDDLIISKTKIQFSTFLYAISLFNDDEAEQNFWTSFFISIRSIETGMPYDEFLSGITFNTKL